MSDWKTLSSEIVYETRWFKVHRDEARDHNGKPRTYSYLEMQHPTAIIVAVRADGQILLQKNYRYPIDQLVWELPAGHTDGEQPLAAAKRELIEEAGLVSDDWTMLGKLFSAPGVAKIKRFIFLARNVQPTAGDRDDEEQITEQRFLGLEEIEAMAQAGQLESSGALAALYLAKLHGLIKEGN